MDDRYGFKKLIVWQRSKDLAGKIIMSIQNSKNFPLRDQIMKSTISIPSNIAEGYGRRGKKEKIQFFYIGLASGAELETQLVIAKDIGELSQESYTIYSEELHQICKMLYGLIGSKQ